MKRYLTIVLGLLATVYVAHQGVDPFPVRPADRRAQARGRWGISSLPSTPSTRQSSWR